MAQCPNCSKPIAITDDQFGTLYRCEHCKTEFFIGFDGAPENSKEPLPSDLNVESSAEPVIQSIDPIFSEMEMPPSNVPIDYGASEPAQSPQTNSDLFNIQPSQDSIAMPEMPSMSEMTMSETSATEPPMSPPTGGAFKNFADDVQNFGNEISEAGVLSFDIEISGIDLGETKRDLIEALDDKRFGWNIDELIQGMKDGRLTISNVSAPKIIVLVKRITPMGLVLNWRHHVATQ